MSVGQVSADNIDHARGLCVQQGGQLAAITSAAENAQALAVMLRYQRKFVSLGAARLATGGWAWPGGVPLTFASWAAGQPDDPERERCSEMCACPPIEHARLRAV